MKAAINSARQSVKDWEQRKGEPGAEEELAAAIRRRDELEDDWRELVGDE